MKMAVLSTKITFVFGNIPRINISLYNICNAIYIYISVSSAKYIL